MRDLALIFVFVFGLITAAVANPVSDFIASDTNKDGLLQKAEFQAFLKRRATAGDSAAKWVVRFGAWGRALKTVDTNNDSIVTPAELRAFDASQ